MKLEKVPCSCVRNPSIHKLKCHKVLLRRMKMILWFSKDSDYVFDLDHEQTIVPFEIDGNGVFGIEQHLVVLTQWYVRWVFDLGGNSYDSAGYRGNFYVVWQSDTAFGLFFVLVFANQDTFAYRLDYFKRLCFNLFFLSISPSSLQNNLFLDTIIIIPF